LLGKEASIFLPSATMANAIACRLHTKPGEAIICEAHCHILNSETGGLAVHSGIVPRLVRGQCGHFTPEQVAEQLTLSGHYRPITTLLACEQMHNAAGGTIWPLEQLQAIYQAAHERRIGTICQRMSLPRYRATCTAEKRYPALRTVCGMVLVLLSVV
jgi:threonine aldolase